MNSRNLVDFDMVNQTKAKYAISFAEKKLLHLIHHEGFLNENVWKISHEIALHSLNLGMSYIKSQNYEKGEVFIMKAKKVTEPPNKSVNWESRLDWQIIRLNIFQNLAIIYKNQKKDEKAYELLKSLVKHLKPENIITQNAEIIISSIDNLYINLANLCYTLQHHDETILYCKIGINFLKNVIKNPELLSKIEILLKRNNEELSGFISNKNTFIAYMFHLIGKAELKLMNESSAVNYFYQAYFVAKENNGENDELTIKYHKKYENLKYLLENKKNANHNEDNLTESLSESMNASQNQSPAGKKALFIKTFVQNQDKQYFFKKDLSNINRENNNTSKEKEDSKQKIALFPSPKHQIYTYEDLIKSQPPIGLEEKSIKNNLNEYQENSMKINDIKVMYPTNHLYLQDFAKSARVNNTHTKSLSNVSDFKSLFLKKPKTKREFHRSHFSQQFPYLENFFLDSHSSGTQRNLLYSVSNLSTRQSPKPTTQPLDLFQKNYNLPENEVIHPPKQYLFLMNNRPNSNEIPINNLNINIQQLDHPFPLPLKMGNFIKKGIQINKVPSITINSIIDLNDKSSKAHNFKTPKSSFSSIKTPTVMKTVSSPMEQFFPDKDTRIQFRNATIKKNISVKIPSKQISNTNSPFNQNNVIKTSHNTPMLLDKKNKGTASSNQFSYNKQNSRKFSVLTPNIMPYHNSHSQKKYIDSNKLIDQDSPMKKEIIQSNLPMTQSESIYLKKQKTIIFNEEPNEVIEPPVDESILVKNALLIIIREIRKCIKKRKKMGLSLNASLQRKSLNRPNKANPEMRNSVINLKNLKTSETYSNVSKFSPRREENIVNSVIEQPKEKTEYDSKEDDIISSVNSDDIENLEFFPIKFFLNHQTSYWSLLGFSFKKKENGYESKLFMRKSYFNIYFSWMIHLNSLNKQKFHANIDYLWNILNMILEIKLQQENQQEFFDLKNKENQYPNGFLDKLPEDHSLNSNDYEEFSEAISKLKFFLKNFFIIKRKIVGKTYLFSNDLEHNNQIFFLSRELKFFLSHKQNFIKNIICKPSQSNPITPTNKIRLKKIQSLDPFDLNDRFSKNPEEYSLFSKISSPATSETNYQKSKNLPPMKSQQRPSISLSLYDNHIRLIKKGKPDDNEKDDDYRFQTLTQPPVLLTQLKTALSNKEINNLDNRSAHGSKKDKDSTVKEVSEDIIELSEDTEKNEEKHEIEEFHEEIEEDEHQNTSDANQQSVMIKKDSISNEYISIENALKAAFYRSESESPQSPTRRLTTSPKHVKLNRKYMRKSMTGKVDEEQFQEIIDNVMKNSWKDEKNLPKMRKMNSFKKKQKFIREELRASTILEEEKSPMKRGGNWSYQRVKPEIYMFKWRYYKDLKPIPCPTGLFPEKNHINMRVPEKFLNGFENNEIFIEKIVKIQNHYFLLTIDLGLSEEIERIIDFIKSVDQDVVNKIMSTFSTNITLFQINSNYKVKYTLTMIFSEFNRQFLDDALDIHFEFLRFFYFKKFERNTLYKLFKNIKKISINKCELSIDDNLIKRKKDSFTHIPSQVIILAEDEDNFTSGETLVLHDPEIIKMRYYNSIKILNKSSYYEKFHDDKGIIYLRVKFLKMEDLEVAKISIYKPLMKQVEYQQITSQIIFEKLVNYMQISNKKAKSNLFKKFFLNCEPNFIGKKISIAVFKREGTNFPELLTSQRDHNLFFYNFAQNIFSKRDNPIIYHYFTVKTFFENYEIENMGRAYLKISMFNLKSCKKGQFSHDFKCFFLFEIYQNSITRYKLHKFILTTDDISTYINFQFSEKNDLNLLSQLNKSVFSNFVYSKDQLYKSLQLPFYRFSQSNSKKFSLLKMDLNKFGLQQTGIKKFLKPQLNAYRIIYQAVKKVFGLFTIITVKKHHILKFWSLGFYFPKTNRDFSISLYNSDIFRMTPGFFEQLFPISMKEIQEIFTTCNTKRITYHLFSMEYEQLMTKNQSKSQDLLFSDDTAKLKKDDTPFFSNSKLIMNFVEIKFWEGIIAQMKFSKTIKGKILVNIDNFYTQANEHLFDRLVMLRNKELIIFDVINEHLYRKFELQNSLRPFKYKESINFILKLKIHELKSTKISNDTLNLQELLHLYMCDTKIQKIRHFDVNIQNLRDFNINHAFLRFLCTFLYLKIRNIKKVISFGYFDDFVKEISNFEEIPYIEEKKAPAIKKENLKLNCKLQIQSLYFNNHKKWLLIYKHFLTIKPRQTIAILYSKFFKRICVILYNNKNSKWYRKFYSLEKLRVHIPYLNEMLSLQEFNIVGERILKSLKNNLLIASFFNLCL